MEIAFIALASLIGIVICHTIAKKRGTNTLFWSVMGALFGPLAILFLSFQNQKMQIN